MNNGVIGKNKTKRKNRAIAKGHYVKGKCISAKDEVEYDNDGNRKTITRAQYEYVVNGKHYQKKLTNRGRSDQKIFYYIKSPRSVFVDEDSHPLDTLEMILFTIAPFTLVAIAMCLLGIVPN